ncbi:MAG: ATP-binding protein [Candidatus Omnitrophica bacterium]|nr:ATP-binding protein [Candidatus Omnitrophota bacterium]
MDFFARDDYLNILEKRFRDLKDGFRHNLAITGEESIGKTSIIQHFLSRFCDPLILPVYVEIKPQTSLKQFVEKFIAVLLYNFLENSGLKRSEKLNRLIVQAKTFLPKTTKEMTEIINAPLKRSSDLFIQLLGLCDSLTSETKKRCVIVFDEFQNLENLGIKNIYKQFSKMLMIQKDVLYILLSSEKFKAKRTLSSKLSLLFGNFEIVEIQPFEPNCAENFLQSFLINIKIKKELIDFLLQFSNSWPYYLKIIGDALRNYRKTELLSQKELAQILENLLFDASGILNLRFRNLLQYLEKANFTYRDQRLLYLIACGKNRLKDIEVAWHKSRKAVVNKLNFLIEEDILTKNGDFYVFNDRIFKFWLRFVWYEGINGQALNLKNERKTFLDRIEEEITQFLLASRKPVIERTMQLLNLFGNEKAQIQSKNLRFKPFKEIKPLSFNHETLKEGILGRAQDSLWLIGIKQEEPLKEDDIAGFIGECRRLRYIKLQTRIIVTDCAIEPNVRLKALQEKICLWDIRQLNYIFDLYNRPRLLV